MDDNRSFGKPAISFVFGVIIFVICFAEAFYILLESPLNPWSGRLAGIDSSIFIYMGEGLLKGLVPYRDMFDHKGPLLWTIEQAGLMLGGGSVTGIWALELIALVFDMIMAYLCAYSVTGHRTEAIISACLSFVPLITLLYEGNLSEEWSLPFIFAGLYIFIQYFNGKRERVKPLEAAAEGVLCGMVLMIRVNGAAMWAVFAIALLVMLLAQKRVREAVLCVALFFGGMLLSFVPYIIWYGFHGTLKEMWDAYIGFNMYYSGLHGGFSLTKAVSLSVYFISTDPMLWLPFAGLALVLVFERRRAYRLLLFVLMGASCLCAALGGEKHIHYAMYLIPCLVLPLAFFLEWVRALSEKGFGKKGILVERCVIIILCIFYLRWDPPVGEQRAHFASLRTMASEDRMMLDHIAENTAEGDEILVTGLNARLYYASGHLCGSRRYIQHFMYDYDLSLMKEMLEYVDNDPPQLIIMPKRNVDGDPWGEWMTAFYNELEKREEMGLFTGFENDVFVSFKRTEGG